MPKATHRTSRRRAAGGPVRGPWFGRIFLIPFMIVGLGLVTLTLAMILWVVAGSETQGWVVRVRPPRRDSGSRQIEYSCRCADDQVTGVSSVPRGQAEAYDRALNSGVEKIEPIAIPVRVLGFSGRCLYHEAFSSMTGRWMGAGFAIVFTLGWNGLLFLMLWAVWGPPSRRRRFEAELQVGES